MVEIINKLLSLATVFADLFLILGVLYFWLQKENDQIKKFLTKNSILFAWIVALSATLLSLYYSNILGFEPCSLCWWQRVFIYPQAIILGMAYFKKEKIEAVKYSYVLTIIGALFALYQNALYYGAPQIGSCDSSITAISCTKLYILEFGYVTIPMMSLTAFLLIIFFLKIAKKK
ncbi:MAG: disulfide bond formation protein B [Candidatus Magasanikbacteria bacterium CG_4_10_14_0_2_um_filter_33_14]|uniref:Disulfide bond formation protein B n=1 Tax=Candidatus Magasanikbacteria bacterium CG_4_10_14_0_2_um_filter_33_14 TaxID=1974636 RepID=A0A2M7V9Q8_9BACT|nr:MAG: disulfide bond formation protein B [Candidatus Magasanikbacteria bacterium CG_4_10_14_0_2_um_filter_33_14]